jgi:tetratricopeptide (TPR) repeat protein
MQTFDRDVGTGARQQSDERISDNTDYAIELQRIERTVADLRDSAFVPPTDTGKLIAYVHGVYQHALLTGNLAELELADSLIADAIAHVRCPGDLYFLKAKVAFALHRLPEVRSDLRAEPSLLATVHGRALLADLDFQEGRYAQARTQYESLVADNRAWDNLARLAHFCARMGEATCADQLYAEAEDELTVKEMRSYAWLELQRGVLDLSHGRHDQADAHYAQAARAYTGYWLVAEHRAELLAARGDFEEAVDLYERVVAQVPRPELQQALGELYARMDRRARAKSWQVRARAGYLESVRRGGVHYYHHLAAFYADVQDDAAEAVAWARKDIAVRDNFSTQAGLAWALYRNGQTAEAVERMRHALASGAQDAHLFSQAAAIWQAAGKPETGARYLAMARAINPHHASFHIHR